MRVFVAGATGVIGRRLVPLLVEAGQEVTGMTRSEAKASDIAAQGAVPVVCDAFDADGLTAAITAAAPRIVIDQLTDLPDLASEIPATGGANARIRREGTRNLLAAVERAAVERFIVQSVAWELSGDSGAAVREMEQMVLDIGGVVVRYGQFWGAGTYHERRPKPPSIHIDQAATATVQLLDHPSGIVEIIDP
jgi:nucleoside-diphosphate-sugar epimerase